jgi:hypothetical protein
MAKTAALRIRIEPGLHQRFLDACKAQDISASQVLREYMKQYVSSQEQTTQQDFFHQASPHAHTN